MCFKSSDIFLLLCSQGPEFRNQSKEGDRRQCAEGQCDLCEFDQGKKACIYKDFKLSQIIHFMTMFVLQDYETDLASYTSGLETLLNIPIKRTMLRSPTMDLNLEVIKPNWKSCLIKTLKQLLAFDDPPVSENTLLFYSCMLIYIMSTNQ